MKQIVPFLLFTLLYSLQAWTQEKEEKSFSYSYFSIGNENISFTEDSSLAPLSTDVTVNNPVLRSGGLYSINDRFDFTISAMSSLTSENSDEEWTVDDSDEGQSFINQFGLESNVLQRNDFSFAIASTGVNLHYKFKQELRAVVGTELTYKTFKRSNFQIFADDAVDDTVVEESVTDIIGIAGVAYEMGSVAAGEPQLGAKVLVGLPIWNRTTNTRYSGVDFNNQGGFDAELELNYHYPLMEGLSLGLFLNYRLTERDGITVENDDLSLEIPENSLKIFRVGIGFNWNFN